MRDGLINLDHLRFLTEPVTFGDQNVAIVHIYSEYPEYEWVDAAGEGIAAVDDVARAALVYLAYYEQTGDSRALDQARLCLDFVRYMQTEDGWFYNFVTRRGRDHQHAGQHQLQNAHGLVGHARTVGAGRRLPRFCGSRSRLRRRSASRLSAYRIRAGGRSAAQLRHVQPASRFFDPGVDSGRRGGYLGGDAAGADQLLPRESEPRYAGVDRARRQWNQRILFWATAPPIRLGCTRSRPTRPATGTPGAATWFTRWPRRAQP